MGERDPGNEFRHLFERSRLGRMLMVISNKDRELICGAEGYPQTAKSSSNIAGVISSLIAATEVLIFVGNPDLAKVLALPILGMAGYFGSLAIRLRRAGRRPPHQ